MGNTTLMYIPFRAQNLGLASQSSKIKNANNDPDQCQVIEHLIDVTKNVVNVLPGKKITKLLANEPTYVISGQVKGMSE